LGKYNDFILPAWNGQMMQTYQVLNRHQDNLDLLFIDGTTGTSKIVLNEKIKHT
jgi:dipeptidyl-peptidase-4